MKDDLRKKLKRLRKTQSIEEIARKSKEIEKKLLSLNEFRNASKILFYVSYDNEVFTHDIIKKCLMEKEIIVPISDTKNNTLKLSKFYKWEDLHESSYGILEPMKIIEKSPNKLDLIIVPGIGFDKRGNRLGHGKGYYDKLLQKLKTIKIGLAFELQIVDQIPTDENDVPVDLIITEDRIINCSNKF